MGKRVKKTACKSCFEELAYIAGIEEPDFGCEGRPENEPIHIKLTCMTSEGRIEVMVEEKLLDESQIKSNVWIGKIRMPEGQRQMAVKDTELDEYLILSEEIAQVFEKAL